MHPVFFDEPPPVSFTPEGLIRFPAQGRLPAALMSQRVAIATARSILAAVAEAQGREAATPAPTPIRQR